MKSFIFYLIILLCIVSCGVKKSPVSPSDDTQVESSSDDEEEK